MVKGFLEELEAIFYNLQKHVIFKSLPCLGGLRSTRAVILEGKISIAFQRWLSGRMMNYDKD
jgi:hypothetical protein